MNASKRQLSDYSVLVRRLLADYFSGRGCHVRQAADGAAALGLIEEQIPDLVLSDIRMPVMDGIELFRIIRERFQRIRHVLMTGYNVDELARCIATHVDQRCGADAGLRQYILPESELAYGRQTR